MDFLCALSSQVDPDYVLRPSVSLYAITDKEVVFVETPDMVNIYSSDVHPFFYVAQFCYAKTVIKMSIKDFVKLADKIGDPKVLVIWMSTTGRCGGTMLSQVFESVPGTLVIHEPYSPKTLYNLLEYGKLHVSKYEGLLVALTRVLCKPQPGVERFFIKPISKAVIMMVDISRLFSHMKQIFVYRNSMDTVLSWLAILEVEYYSFVMANCVDAICFSRMCPYFRNLLHRMYIPKPIYSPNLPYDANMACALTYKWVNSIVIARNAMSRDHCIYPIKYEDVIAKPEDAVRRLFAWLKIDGDYVGQAILTLSRDSQRVSSVSRDKLKAAPKRNISMADRVKCNAILNIFSLPCLGEDFRI